MSEPYTISLPSEEEQQAKLAPWKSQLVTKYLVDERDGECSVLQYNNPPQSNKSDKSDKDAVDEEPWQVKKDGRVMVVASKLPGHTRVLWPGMPMTLDLWPNRLNIHCDEDGKITNVNFG
ncbi:hypothetical protein GGF46_004261 [Coemansia sp. RSA 552]|nr:hypothetical protein GGF46_004261 [Coemansia sp. RSA 552]